MSKITPEIQRGLDASAEIRRRQAEIGFVPLALRFPAQGAQVGSSSLSDLF